AEIDCLVLLYKKKQRVTQTLVMRLRQHEETVAREGTGIARIRQRDMIQWYVGQQNEKNNYNSMEEAKAEVTKIKAIIDFGHKLQSLIRREGHLIVVDEEEAPSFAKCKLKYREDQVRRIRHGEEIDVLEYQVLTREIEPTLKALEEITQENVFCLRERKTRKDRGTRRGRHSTSSSSAFDQPSSFYLNDDDDDGNGEGTSRASTHSPIRYVNSLTNQVPQVFQNSPNIDPHLETFYTRQIKIITRQVQIRDEQRGELRSIGKGLRNLWRNIKK
ncbi:DNA helicase PIF1-like protein, partial [Tanacetum coccineum]